MPGSPNRDGGAPTTVDMRGGSSLETGAKVGKKKICCACPDTKKARDECIVINGEEACKNLIEAHKQCLRAEGFNV